ncbi:hypothetical protein, variant [Blastomyces dermatitidis ER-3]|uniref:Uncharacterized protein n=3 Tax=Blastomyces TaxID=229219 RepID=A0A179UZ19_BLAGS|nr:uncharacterized protein BDBG_08560 [Blastomyces gilchristii SLH14081]XP_045281832.1 hypothetical protein, variant [Blastomyces dermatitidis ER-3]EGE83030.2 hypothetical protein BDDG_05974 [Blastomyces dermatitidis ATCC 18188]EQL31877.1 hypothetical protein BDFG_05921 [Blastomyces dermatitidis ATCC 26199]OAT02105.1 hypothetical protein, variant [Blastomyces dermatitidis ER-3]OAT13336.1 hypothetical protein BDBG_08560 [Blastomyces gilchristii SLH14081]
MGRTVDQEVHAAFVEFRAKEDDKCLSVQCIYCQQIRAKNTSRQKQHLLECPALRGHNPPHPQSAPTNGVGPVNGYGAAPNGPAGGPGAGALQTPMQNLSSRPSLPSQAAPPPSASSAAPQAQQRAHSTPKSSKQPRQSTSSLPAPPLDDVHAAFVEFRAKEEDKCLSVQCIYCQQVRAKNTSRQRQHLLECPPYLNVMKDSIPANNLQHSFPEGDIARSLQLPIPTLELDFRMSLKLNPTVTVGQGLWGQRDWVTFVGGQWAGRWGKGIVLPGGQDSQVVVKELSTHIKANYLLQTADEPPAFIVAKTTGWMTGAKDVLEKLADPSMADSVNPTTYKYRINISLETGDERYAFVNTVMWVGSGCRRSSEVIFDAFRIT